MFKMILTALLGLGMMALAAGPKGNMGTMYQSVPTEKAELLQKGEEKLYCPNCGMHLPRFYKTGHAMKLKSGEMRQYCSIHCLVEELELTHLRGKKDQVDRVMVVDNESLKFINANRAYYVVGSKIPGTMTMNSKYAFATQKGADAFAKENGGKVKSYEEVYEIALNDFASDMAMVYKKRSGKVWKKGEMLYNKKCDKSKLNTLHAHNMAAMKSAVAKSGACGELNDMQLQALSLYLWDVRMEKFEENYGKNERIQKKIKAMQ